MRRLHVIIGAALLATTVLVSSCDDDDDDDGTGPQTLRFQTGEMTGANERPDPVTSTGTGRATFDLTGTGDARQVAYSVNITSPLTNEITAAHIHIGGPEEAGGILVLLFGGTNTAAGFTGTLPGPNGNRFTASDIRGIGTDAPISMDSLVRLMQLGNAYVNVHTTTNPAGEIRAQIAPVP